MEIDNNFSPAPAPQPEKGQYHVRSVLALILISLIAGAFGGAYAARFFNPGGFRATLPPGSTENITVKEDSAIVDVVRQASPAVVSIVISKDISKAMGAGNSFFDSPFAPFFGFGQPAPNQPQPPNVQPVGAGSGFFVSSDGLILTNKHVVADTQASYTVVTTDGQSYEAQVLSRDPVNDLAILKVNIKNAPTLTLGDSAQIQIGQHVVAIGNSLGEYRNTVTSGIVSAIGRSIIAGGQGTAENLEGVIQTDAAINPGNSGGPLLNLAGQVIGINTAVDQQGQSVGFALPANDAKKDLTSFQKTGKISQPFLGIRFVIITPSLAQSQKLAKDYGALIVPGQTAAEPAVISGSPAETAGLAENDIILEVNGHKITQDNTLTRELKNYSVGDTITVKIYRNGQEKTVSVTLAEAK